jgi:hypothetical protein
MMHIRSAIARTAGDISTAEDGRAVDGLVVYYPIFWGRCFVRPYNAPTTAGRCRDSGRRR